MENKESPQQETSVSGSTSSDPNDQDYEDLLPLSSSVDFYYLVNTIIGSFTELKETEITKDNVFIYDSLILFLRILNKYNMTYFNRIFDTIFDHMRFLFRCRLPRIVRSTIILISEVFLNYMNHQYNADWIPDLLSEMIFIAGSRHILHEWASGSLKGYAYYVLHEEGIETLINLLTNENPNVSDVSFQVLQDLLVNFDEVSMTMLRDWESVLCQIHRLAEMNDHRYSRKASKLVKFLYKQFYFHIDFYEQKLDYCEEKYIVLNTLSVLLAEDREFDIIIRQKDLRNDIKISKYHRKQEKKANLHDREWFNEVVYYDSGHNLGAR
jgi:hypothetical protein